MPKRLATDNFDSQGGMKHLPGQSRLRAEGGEPAQQNDRAGADSGRCRSCEGAKVQPGRAALSTFFSTAHALLCGASHYFDFVPVALLFPVSAFWFVGKRERGL